MNAMSFIEFIVAISALMLIARKSLWLALTFSALLLGIISLSFSDLSVVVSTTLFDPSIILLSISVALIAMIGGSMEMTGLIDEMMDNAKISRRHALLTIPAVLGLLPIPGGALLSAPVVEKGAGKAEPDIKASINIWSRHVTVLFYPLGTLLAASKMAGLNVYTIILYLLPGLVLTIVLIWAFLLRKVEGGRISSGGTIKKALAPILLILTAPLVHAGLMHAFPNVMEEIFLLIGVSLSLSLVMIFKRKGPSYLLPVLKKMKAYNFALIIIGMFLFLNVFNSSNAPGAVAYLPLSTPLLIVLAGGLLGVATGRVNVPISVMLPILTAKGMIVNEISFTILFFSIFIGFLISPVHPCVSVSLEYFRTDYPSTLKRTFIPATISWSLALITAYLLL
ncbi:MAG: DUF401 family protein [Candidatus Thermoplasmatota archaeon]|nr:DUF401 family protein [Candidatus Thermoplasmatota archaeon]